MSHRIIPFFSVIQIISTSAAPCSLCLDGSEISQFFQGKPVVGLVAPVAIPSCESLQDMLSMLDDDSPLCQSGRQLGPYCGCPVAENACRICGTSEAYINQTLELVDPSLSLAGLVENLPDTFGLEPTCELFESGLNLLNNTDEQCGDLKVQELRLHCKCENPGVTQEFPDRCSFCITGEDPHNMSVTGLVFFNDSPKLSSCQSLWDLSLETSADSPTCTSIHEHTYSCNCPEVPNACRMCDNEMLHGEAQITDSSGKQIYCLNYEARLRTMEQTDPQCHVTVDMIETCGCVDKLPDNLCTLCPDGSKVGNPDKDLTDQLAFLDQYLGIDVLPSPLTCAFVDLAIGSITLLGSPICDSAQLLAKLCGCPSKEDACHLCGSGEGHVMTKPLAKTIWLFEHASDNIDLDLAFQGDTAWDLATIDKPISCELLDSGLASTLHADSTHCFSNQMTFSELCGCEPRNRKADILVWCQRFSGILSFLASLSIMLYILRQPNSKRWTTYNQSLAGISLFDSIGSLSLILGPWMIPDTYGSFQSIGNDATCKLQGFMFQLGQTSMFYNVVLSAYFLLVIKYGWSERKCGKLMKWGHVGVLFVGFSMAFASIPFHRPQLRWCYVLRPPATASYLPATMFLIVPISLAILLITGQTLAMVLFVWKKERKTMKVSMTKRKVNLARRAFVQSLWYLLAFYLVWPVLFGSYLLWMTQGNFWCVVVASILGPSQGFFNAIIFFHKRRASLATTHLGLRLSSSVRRINHRLHARSLTFSNQQDDTEQGTSGSLLRSASLSGFLVRFLTSQRNSNGESAEFDSSITMNKQNDGEEEKAPERLDDSDSTSLTVTANMPLSNASRHDSDQDISVDDYNLMGGISLDHGAESFQMGEEIEIAEVRSASPPRSPRESETMRRRVSVLLGIHEIGLEFSDEEADDSDEVERAFRTNCDKTHLVNPGTSGGRARRASLPLLSRRSHVGSSVSRRLSSLVSRVVPDFSVDEDESDSHAKPCSGALSDSMQADDEDFDRKCGDEKEASSSDRVDFEESYQPEQTIDDNCTFTGLGERGHPSTESFKSLSQEESVSGDVIIHVQDFPAICVDNKQSSRPKHGSMKEFEKCSARKDCMSTGLPSSDGNGEVGYASEEESDNRNSELCSSKEEMEIPWQETRSGSTKSYSDQAE